jgi:hypothetical protein
LRGIPLDAGCRVKSSVSIPVITALGASAILVPWIVCDSFGLAGSRLTASWVSGGLVALAGILAHFWFGRAARVAPLAPPAPPPSAYGARAAETAPFPADDEQTAKDAALAALGIIVPHATPRVDSRGG